MTIISWVFLGLELRGMRCAFVCVVLISRNGELHSYEVEQVGNKWESSHI
jgi:hypothetical protein